MMKKSKKDQSFGPDIVLTVSRFLHALVGCLGEDEQLYPTRTMQNLEGSC